MILRVKENLSINNLRNHSPETVEELRTLLTGGVSARLDPRRKNFYELDAGSRVFYIHWTADKARVMFLAVWSKERRQDNVRTDDHVPALCCSPRE
jgi:hypothetical protein